MTTGSPPAPSPLYPGEDLIHLLYLCPVAIAKLDGHGNILLMNPHGTQLLMMISQNRELAAAAGRKGGEASQGARRKPS